MLLNEVRLVLAGTPEDICLSPMICFPIVILHKNGEGFTWRGKGQKYPNGYQVIATASVMMASLSGEFVCVRLNEDYNDALSLEIRWENRRLFGEHRIILSDKPHAVWFADQHR